jgi:hypothetical protein
VTRGDLHKPLGYGVLKRAICDPRTLSAVELWKLRKSALDEKEW